MKTSENKHIRRDRKTIFIALYLFVLFFSIYVLTCSDMMLYDTDASAARYEVTKSLVERFDFSVPDGLGFKGTDGSEYSWYGLGQSLVAVPFYILGKAIGTPEDAVTLMNQVIGAAIAVVVFLFALSLGYSRNVSVFIAVIYGLGTMAWPLTKQPFDHTLETLFVILSIFFMYYYSAHKKGLYILLAAFTAGFAFLTRPTAILVVPPVFFLMLYYSFKPSGFKMNRDKVIKNILLFSLGLLPFIILILWYNYYRFGSIFETGFSLIGEHTRIDFFTGTPLLTGLSGFLVSPGKGFFYYSPVALLFFFSIRSFIKKYPEIGISFILIILSYLLFLSKNIYWHGDWSWGPRYLLALTPFFIIPTAEIFSSDTWSTKKLRKGVLYSIVILSLIIQIAAVSVDYSKHLTKLRFGEHLDFSVVLAQDLQPIVEPPPETYFDWKRSPILAQFKYIYEISNNIKDYQYAEPVKGASIPEKMRAAPFYNIYDFWWLYKYFVDGSYSGIVMAVILLSLALYSAVKLWRMLYRC
jgi:4-amino-4-deoxy-L-arabinose transferase-like glycosyltransferase